MKAISLKEICTLKQWKTIPAKEMTETGYPVYGANGIIGFYSDWNHDEPTIMICCRGATCGAINVSKEKCYINGNAMCLDNLSNSFDFNFVVYFLKHYDFNRVITGAAQPQITQTRLENVYIPIVGIDKQKEISLMLANIEKAITNENEILEKYNELIKSRFIEMFGIRFAGKTIKLSKMAQTWIGLTYKPDNVSDEGTIVLRSGNIQNNELQVESDVVRVSNIKIGEHKYVQENDILMCSRNGSARLVGKTCIIKEIKEPMAFGAFMAIIRSEFPYFLQGFFTSDFFRHQLTNTATSSVNQITSKMLNDYNVIPVSKEDELQFASFVKQIDKLRFVGHSRYFL